MENLDKNTKKNNNTNTKANVIETNKPPDKLKSVSKTLPLVRQTLTSYKRMLKANPLMKYQEAGLNIDQLVGLKCGGTEVKEDANSAVVNYKTSSSSGVKAKEFKKPDVRMLKRTQSAKLPNSNGMDELRVNFKKPTFSTSLSNNTAAKSKINNDVENGKPIECTTKSKFLPKYSYALKPKLLENNTNQETESMNHKPKQPENNVSTLGRSLSSNNLPSQKYIIKPNQISTEPSTSSQVAQNMHSIANKFPDISPISEGSSHKNDFIFKSPSAYKRRSLSCSCTPNSAKTHSLLESSTPAFVERYHLQKKLLKWLELRGKPISSFKHLRYFEEKDQEENKENINIANEKLESHEIVTTPDSSKVNIPVQNDTLDGELSTVAKNAMVELQELIQENYPRAQCLGWLELIIEKHKTADKEPEYWKCRAAIEQSVGNVGNAVEFYKIAIVQGAEVSTVDKSLDQLLKKFSLLNISPNKSKQKKNDGNRTRILREARNVFKSTIIQCAVHERKLKKLA